MRQRRVFGRGKENAGASIEMAPLIDIVFILLIFFVVTTSFVKNSGVEVDRPSSQRTRALDTAALNIAITKQGDVFINSTKIKADDVSTIKNNLERIGTSQVLLEADRASQTGIVLKVYDACFAAGAKTVNIAAVTP